MCAIVSTNKDHQYARIKEQVPAGTWSYPQHLPATVEMGKHIPGGQQLPQPERQQGWGYTTMPDSAQALGIPDTPT